MATVKEINHDSSTTLSDFYSSITDLDGALTVTPAAALDGSVNGVNFDADAGANVPIISESFTAISGNEVRFRARINIDNITIFSAGNNIMDFRIIDSAVNSVFRVILNANAGGTGATLTLQAITDIGITVIGLDTAVSSGDTCFEVRAIRETADGNADGIADFFVGGALAGSATDLENFNNWAANGGMQDVRISFGPLHSGDLYYDEFILDDDASINLGCFFLTLAAMTKPADVDAAGSFIYVSLLQGGTPILTKVSTALDSDGTTVFDPGAGTNIGVQCSAFDATKLWVGGVFDGTNTLEISEDSGGTFTSIDGASNFLDVRTFLVGPDSEDRIMLYERSDNDIWETINGGAAWTNIREVDEHINDIARLGINVQELITVNDSFEPVYFSINSGVDMKDYQTGVYPNTNGTKAIVNG